MHGSGIGIRMPIHESRCTDRLKFLRPHAVIASMQPTRSRHARSEHAIGLVEIVVVLLIIAITLSIGFNAIRSARQAGTLNAAVSTAQEYANAADRFRRDHDGRYPGAPGSADWPSAERDKGPKASNNLLGAQTYLKQVPEAVQSGTISIESSPTAAAWLEYRPRGSGFEITVRFQSGRDPCSIVGGGATASNPVCSKH